MDELDKLIEQFNNLRGNDADNGYYLTANRRGNTVQIRDSLTLLMTVSYGGLEIYGLVEFLDRDETVLIGKMVEECIEMNN
ncbi:hypothetical protein [Liquorilactobacillus mali]|uniref:Uncharacterized protein n=1 Tax=Liquorilactobacillus mali KCTC 3596 = DSM 20444 TaxID=1046596 RepID=A0A0R2E6Q1_9LACO|nr:hypothetical protein [Liquorilactobacillus mali]KRN09365.1 hypothetical protein FD00_GL001088 [Liquorilactobacillus mali KCTC 3596 = DSM 20444]